MGDSYRPPPPPPDRYGGRGDGQFTFRGAADQYRPHDQRRAEETFDFTPINQPTGRPAPRFPAQQPPPREPRNDRHKNARYDPRGGRGRGGRQGGKPFRFVPKPAHARALLNQGERATTPEQLEGMNLEGHVRYVDNESDTSEDASQASDNEDDNPAEDPDNDSSRKRIKTNDGEVARPKWSNPDPYSALPPTDLGLQPKKDIVQTIRKAKVDAGQKSEANAIKENVDFISFDFGEEPSNARVEHDVIDLTDDQPIEHSVDDFLMPSDTELARQYAGSNKRRRADDQRADSGYIVDEWAPDHSNPTPWFNREQRFQANTGLQLHTEIVDFYEYVKPYRHEAEIREDLIDRIEYVVRQTKGAIHQDVRIESFGSFASNLYLPTADMDLVAISKSFKERGHKTFSSKSKMWELAHLLERNAIAKPGSMAVIAKAKVPIIKFVDRRTGIKVDISFENDSGLYANRTFKAWKAEYPEMPVLVMIIKQFLAMRGLNEVFNGGIGGFTIICLVVSMLQLMPENQRKSVDMQSRYGELLLNFFDLYGNKFNLQEVGIMMEPARLFDKKDPNACDAKLNANGLTIIDPNNSSNDISGGSKKVDMVFSCFRGALYEIQQQLSKAHRGGWQQHESILGCILAGNYTSFREQRELFDRLDRAERPPPSLRMAPRPPIPSYPTQQPWQQHSHPVPTVRDRDYHRLQDGHDLARPEMPLPRRPAAVQAQQSGFSPRPPPPGPGTSLGQANVHEGGNGNKKLTRAEKRAKKAEKAARRQANGGPAPSQVETKPETKKEKLKRERKEHQKKLKKEKAKKKTPEEKRAKNTAARDQRASKRLKTLYGDVP